MKEGEVMYTGTQLPGFNKTMDVAFEYWSDTEGCEFPVGDNTLCGEPAIWYCVWGIEHDGVEEISVCAKHLRMILANGFRHPVDSEFDNSLTGEGIEL